MFKVSITRIFETYHRIETDVMIHAVGDDGDGKGNQSQLETAVLGRTLHVLVASPTISSGFRVGISERKGRHNFEFDIWKRFVVDEDIFVQCNFSQTVKIRFKGMKTSGMVTSTTCTRYFLQRIPWFPTISMTELLCQLSSKRTSFPTQISSTLPRVFSKRYLSLNCKRF